MNVLAPGDLAGFVQAVGKQGPLVALDVGTKTIGVAISDTNRQIASPIETIRRTKFTHDAAIIQRLVDKEQVVGLVIGWPVSMDGRVGPRAQATRAFKRKLSDHINQPMLLWDERLSTQAAKEIQASVIAPISRAAASVDALAASVILRSLLEQIPTNTNR